MKIVINGEEKTVMLDSNLDTVIQQHNLPGHTFVVELNGKIIDESNYSSSLLHEGDRMEIIRFVGGG